MMPCSNSVSLTADVLALHVGVVDDRVHGDEVGRLQEPLVPNVDLLFDPGAEWQANAGVDDVDDKLQVGWSMSSACSIKPRTVTYLPRELE